MNISCFLELPSSSKEFAKRLSASDFRAFSGLTLQLRHQDDNETLLPLLEHSTTRNHVDYYAYPAQLAQHWPEGLFKTRARLSALDLANTSQDFGHQMQVRPP